MLLEDGAVAVRGQTLGNVAYAFANQSGDWGNFDFRLKPDSEAIDMGIPLPLVTTAYKGTAPDTGVLEFGEDMYGIEGKFPRLPGWLLKEWPLGRSQLEIRATKTPTD